ncbi:hypothetical protein THAOC_19901, partial [Thalassiosira oceanica]
AVRGPAQSTPALGELESEAERDRPGPSTPSLGGLESEARSERPGSSTPSLGELESEAERDRPGSSAPSPGGLDSEASPFKKIPKTTSLPIPASATQHTAPTLEGFPAPARIYKPHRDILFTQSLHPPTQNPPFLWHMVAMVN